MAKRYQDALRRVLIDMHIPDWDEGFLAAYDPKRTAELIASSGAEGAMVYTKSHLGLCYWPTERGRQHQGLGGRDVLGELVAELRARDLGVCAYYSVVFDNWAAECHPEWRQVNAASVDYWPFMRYGVCCLNNAEYRSYEHDLFVEMLGTNDFDSVFVDMAFWPLICGCPACRDRYQAESGCPLPERINWLDPEWCAFQAARERWADEMASDFAALTARHAPGTTFTHNFAPAWMGDWHYGQPITSARHDDYVAGDLYGDRVEQLVVSKLMLHLGGTARPEFMTSVTADLRDHSRHKSVAALRAQAAAAAASLSAAFLVIDAVDPRGSLEEALYRQKLPAVFAPYDGLEHLLDGDPVEEVLVYLAVDSQADLSSSGKALTDAGEPTGRSRHLDAVRGACLALQRAHVPFGVITRSSLGDLDVGQVLVLANAERLSGDEVARIEDFVARGGRLYASRYSSLLDSDQGMLEEFALGPVLGVRLVGHEEGQWIYMALGEETRSWAAGARYVGHPLGRTGVLASVPRVEPRAGARSLARVSLPYGHPAAGTAADRAWASIHSSPPWQDLDVAGLVENRYGDGRAIYCSADIETMSAEADVALFLSAIGRLRQGEAAFEVDAHPALWASATTSSAGNRTVLSLLNYPADLPPVAAKAEFSVAVPEGRRLGEIRVHPADAGLVGVVSEGHRVRGEVERVEELVLVELGWEPR